ncbi:hypothetical protein [Gluconobacter frateurii]|uniref:Uncharacterized protein n=1 Tax=Gluconobacter frateurii NRIC 0228 TaxID=1307946 RepID=A0ABQ0QFJ0_9PROT|nr:hypothetical protein [Gluconobacter frateurii]GBR17489.1 hypothetical protein AA0228_3040 [Gluconobacter frateurii NRIC 0228]GLP89618.1 hypothetical protein GCM10007868_06930 [Gluconobacter frateurii]
MKNKILSKELINLIKNTTTPSVKAGVYSGGLEQFENVSSTFTVVSNEAQSKVECEFQGSRIILKFESKVTPFIHEVNGIISTPREVAYIVLGKHPLGNGVIYMHPNHTDEVKEEINMLIATL